VNNQFFTLNRQAVGKVSQGIITHGNHLLKI